MNFENSYLLIFYCVWADEKREKFSFRLALFPPHQLDFACLLFREKKSIREFKYFRLMHIGWSFESAFEAPSIVILHRQKRFSSNPALLPFRQIFGP